MPWLETGLTLLKIGSLAYERDYLVPLPNSDLSGTCGLRAVYADAVGLSRSLLTSLRQPLGTKGLISPAASRFWTEHSDRTGCTGWCSSLGIITERRGFLGRWAVTASADAYVRIAFREVENLQVIAAKAGRLALDGGPDFFGEEVILEQLEVFLRSKGVSEIEIGDQLLALTTADASKPIPPDPLQFLNKDEHAVDLEPPVLLDVLPGTPTPTGEVDALEAPATTAIESEDLLMASKDRALADQADAPDGFVIQLTIRKVRRLHFVGCCAKIPGEHYKAFEVYGDMLPNELDFDCLCRVCFKDGDLKPSSLGPDQEPLELEVSSSSSTSSSSSSSESGEGEKRTVRRRKS